LPGPEDRLKGALERLAAPADPSGAYERILEKKVRRRIVRRVELAALALVVLAGTVGGTFALAHVFRTTSKRVPIAPTARKTPSAGPAPTPSPSPAQPLPRCATSWVNGDFDGDGLLDTAAVCRLKGGTFSLNVRWAGGAAGAVSLPDCQSVCEARGAGDLNGDGIDEFFLLYSGGASTDFVEVYELPASEAFGQHPAKIARPGSPPGFPAGAPAQFDLGGSVTHQGYLTCTGPQGGSREIVATGTVLSPDQTTWKVHETVFTFSAGKGRTGRFKVVSARDYTAPVDPNTPFVPLGDPCLDI
jgi:hypothetical protein